jgi:hypothetical protein
MDKSPLEKERILDEVGRLRKHITYIILSYEDLYGTTELISPDDDLILVFRASMTK